MGIDSNLDPVILAMHMEKNTVKFLNFRTPKFFAVSYLKFKQRGQTIGYFVKMVQAGSAMFAQTYLSENLRSLL